MAQDLDRLLHHRQVQRRAGISRSSIYRLMALGRFPAPIRIGLRAVRWSENEIENWISSRQRAQTNHST